MTPDTILIGHVLDILPTLPDQSVNCCVTSPPYWGLRDYGVDGQIGLEKTPVEYIETMVRVFREVRRVLRDDGTLWLNLGDSYSAGTKDYNSFRRDRACVCVPRIDQDDSGLPPKNLVGVPWRVALALQADGWYLRSDIIWSKPNPMPESVTDRPTKAHEYVFLLSKRERYYYDAEAVKESTEDSNTHSRGPAPHEMPKTVIPGQGIKNNSSWTEATWGRVSFRNRRTVWTIPTQPFPGAHFATFPEKLVEPCILAGCPQKACPVCGEPWERVVEKKKAPRGDSFGKKEIAKYDHGQAGSAYMVTVEIIDRGFRPTCPHDAAPVSGIVLDPFFGAGTVGVVALKKGRHYLGIELNPEYAEMARNRIKHGTVDPEEVAEAERQGDLIGPDEVRELVYRQGEL